MGLIEPLVLYVSNHELIPTFSYFKHSLLQLSPCYPDKAVQREISDLDVYCRNKPYGCNWTGRMADYAQVSIIINIDNLRHTCMKMHLPGDFLY